MAQQFDYPKTETQLREIQDALYQHSKEVYEAGGRPAFKGLLEIMSAESTIITAIHNIKGNHGSETPGVDSKTMRKDYLQKPFPWVVADTLLPHCRYQTPNWLSDTIRCLLDEYETCGKKLPFYSRAMLVIDEHTGIEGRHIYDQDNKGWKAISNAIKGRLIPDDDQHTLAVALLSTECFEHECCHITLLPLEDAHDFFAAHSSDYASQDFYSGQWC